MTKVAILQCSHYDQQEIRSALDRGITPLGGWNRYIKPGQKVLLKVNLIGPCPPSQAATTHPEVVRALIRICREHGCEVWVGDSAGGAIAGMAPTAKGMKVAGFEAVAQEEGAKIINFDQAGAVEIASETGRFVNSFFIAKPVIDADVVINLPKFKAHSAAVYTGAVKNVFGCIPGLRKAEYHKMAPSPEDFGEIIADIHLACGINLNILDGIIGMEGAGPTAGNPKELGYLLMSADALALDRVAIEMIGLDLTQVPILRQAESLKVGEADLDRIEVVGDTKEIPRVDFQIPASVNRRGSGLALRGIINFFKVRPKVNLKKCKHCQTCVGSCPVEVIDNKTKEIDYQRCIECLCCHELCPYQAVELKRSNPIAGIILPLASKFGHGKRKS